MNESTGLPQPLFAPKWALRFGAALLAAMAVVVVFASFERQRQAQVESTSETTAVGDVKYFKPPANAKMLPIRGASLNGRALMVAAIDVIEVRDTHVRRVDHDPASGLAIYKLSPAATVEERERAGKRGENFLLKTAPGEYVNTQGSAP